MRRGELYLLRHESQTPLLGSVMHAAAAWERMRGLLWRPRLLENEALLIDRCAAVHTLGMGYPLDLAFLDRRWVIGRLARGVAPWRFAWHFPAAMTLEMAPGTIDRLQLETGMQLLWQDSGK
jgi:uncharacterized protein